MPNASDKIIEIGRGTALEEKLKQVLEIMKLPPQPSGKRKSLVHKQTLKKNENLYLRSAPFG